MAKRDIIGLLAGLALYAAPIPAPAALLTRIYTGTFSGNDNLDLFGGGNLSGDTFTATFTYDLSQATLDGNPGRSTTSTEDSVSARGPIPYGALTINVNGVTDSFIGQAATSSFYSGIASVSDTSIYSTINSNPLQFSFSAGISATQDPSLDTTISGDNLPVIQSIDGDTYTQTFGASIYNPNTFQQDAFTVAAYSSTTASISAVPLPASLPMFAATLLGITGFEFWRRRRVDAAIVA